MRSSERLGFPPRQWKQQLVEGQVVKCAGKHLSKKKGHCRDDLKRIRSVFPPPSWTDPKKAAIVVCALRSSPH